MPALEIGKLDDLQGLRFMAHPTKPSITVCYVFFQLQLQLPA